MDITRRKFFFFGLAAGVGLFLPDRKLEPNWVWDTTRFDVYDTREDMVEMIKKLEQDKKNNPPWLYGIPYHQDNSTTSEWLGFSRT